MPAPRPPHRTETYASLPPYSSPRQSWNNGGQSLQPKTPAELLGLQIDHKDKKHDVEPKGRSPSDSPFPILTNGEGMLFAPPKLGPIASRPSQSSSELEAVGLLEGLRSYAKTGTKEAISPEALGIFNSWSAPTSPGSQIFASPPVSSNPASRKPSLAESIAPETKQVCFSLESASIEMTMRDLRGVRM